MNIRKWSPRMRNIYTILERTKQPQYRYLEFIQLLYKQRIFAFDEMTTLPSSLRATLKDELGDTILTLGAQHESKSAQCTKTLHKLRDNHNIETVYMQFRDSQHTSLCVSSQVGCALKCNFCATGAVGLKRQLTADEIVDQVLHVQKTDPLNTISFMGMGEALQNPRVFDALHTLKHPQLMGISPRRISVSTVGIIPGIQRLTREFPEVNLAFSLHSPFEEQRDLLVPANKTHPLPEVLKVLEQHALTTRRKIFIAYLVLPGINDSETHAKALCEIIRRMSPSIRRLFHVNLLRYNPAESISGSYKQTTSSDLEKFSSMLKKFGDVSHTIRQSFGVEIDAACGQLYQIANKNSAAAANVANL